MCLLCVTDVVVGVYILYLEMKCPLYAVRPSIWQSVNSLLFVVGGKAGRASSRHSRYHHVSFPSEPSKSVL